MRPYRLIFYFFKCYLDRVQYQLLINILSTHTVKYCHFTKVKIIMKWLSFNANK